MKEHAKLLEFYSRMFEETTLRINIAREFKETMLKGARFPEAEINDFIQVKLRGAMASEVGSQFRGNGSA